MARKSRSRGKVSAGRFAPRCKLFVAGTGSVPKQPPFAENDAAFGQANK